MSALERTGYVLTEKISSLSKLSSKLSFLRYFGKLRTIGWTAYAAIVFIKIVESIENLKIQTAESQNPVSTVIISLKVILVPLFTKIYGFDADILRIANYTLTTESISAMTWITNGFGLLVGFLFLSHLFIGGKIPIIHWDISFAQLHNKDVGVSGTDKSWADYRWGIAIGALATYFIAMYFVKPTPEENYFPFKGVLTLFKNIIMNPRQMFPLV